MTDVTTFRIPLAIPSVIKGAPVFILSGLLLTGASPSANRPEPSPQPAPVQADEPAAPPTRNGRPAPAEPPAAEPVAEEPEVEAPPAHEAAPVQPVAEGDAAPKTPHITRSIESTRRPKNKDMVIDGLWMEEAKVDQFVPFIMEWTGKHVIVKPNNIKSYSITIMTEKKMTPNEALSLLYEAFRVNEVGVIETDDLVVIDARANLTPYRRITLSPEDDVTQLTDDGNFYEKVYQLKNAKVENILDLVNEALHDPATIQPDPNTNELVVYRADVALLKRLQTIIDAVDKPPRVEVKRETFRLIYADAQSIADNLRDIYEDSSSGGRANAPRGNNNPRGGNRPTQPNPNATGEVTVGVSEQLRITVLPAINTLTVSAEPQILEQIREQVRLWDIPRPKDITKIYQLVYADPLVVRDAVNSILGSGSSSTRGGNRASGAARGGGSPTGGAGADGGAAVAVENTYRVEAVGDKRQLVVISKTPENLDWLDALIAAMDQPTSIGKPIMIPLKYAQAVEISEQLNALFAPASADPSITAPDSDLRFSADANVDAATSGGGSSAASTGGRSDSATGGGRSGGTSGVINFPWANAREGDSATSPESEIIGKVRIVPIVRQNALQVLAAPEYQKTVMEIVQQMDRPGRQVMIAATIAQVELRDEFAWGVRVSSGDISPALTDNFVSGAITSENTKDDFISVFDTSVLNANFNLNASLQALDQKTDVKILQQPRVFTADNQEAVFFQGQRIPFITDSTTTDVGGITQSFDYLNVGVKLNVRPRITIERDVSLDVFFELSNTVPGQFLFGGQIIDLRQTETHVVVKDGQTIVISGIRIESESNIDRKVPLLGDIPVVGALFTSTDKSKVVNELLIFITPLVVDNPEENDNNFNEAERRKLEEVARPLEKIKERRKRGVDPINAPTIGKVTTINPETGRVEEAPMNEVVETEEAVGHTVEPEVPEKEN